MSIQSAVVKLVDKFGFEVTLKTVTAGAYDVQSSTMPVTSESRIVKAVFSTETDRIVMTEINTSNLLLKPTDINGVLIGSINTGDEVVINSITYKITHVTTLLPQGVVAGYICRLES